MLLSKRTVLYPVFLAFALLGPVSARADAGETLEQVIRTQTEQAQYTVKTFEEQLFAEGLTRLYAPNGYQPLWEASGRFEELLQALEQTGDDGLDAEKNGLPQLRRFPAPQDATLEQRACRDVLATRAYLLTLAYLSQGQLDAATVEPYWQPDGRPRFGQRDIAAALQLAEAGLKNTPEDAFAHARPALPLYGKLRNAYVLLRQQASQGGGWPAIPPGEFLRPGEQDARVPLLRQRLAIDGSSAENTDAAPSERYDDVLVDAVKRFQRNHYLDVDGIVGKATLAELNMPVGERVGQLRVNLERARWLAREMEAHMVLVDIAGAQVFYYQNGTPVLQSRAQVGTLSRATPLLKSSVTHFTFNPTWTVPPTILRKDKLPRIRQDIGYLQRNNYHVLDRDGNELDPESIDWNRPGAIILRQNSGPGNALGRVAIRFPNPHAVYLHDTPSKRLFDRGQRTFSSGCVRVEKALDLVSQLIHDAGNLDEAGVQRVLDSGRMGNVSLLNPVPILLAYWTADTDEGGQVVFRPDIYHKDKRLLQALDSMPPAISAAAHGCAPPPSSRPAD